MVLGWALLLGSGAGCRRAAVPTEAGATMRVVSLAPSLTELVCALDAAELLVGRTSVCDYPPAAVSNIPVIGDFGVPSLELLLVAKPTLILDVALADEALGRKFSQLRLRRERVPCNTLDDIPIAMLTLGRLLNREPQARALAEPLRLQIQELRAAAAQTTRRPRVFVEIWNDPLTTAGTNSFLAELVRLAGGENLGDSVDKDYFQIAPEWVVQRDPEVILCFYMTGGALPSRRVLERTGWANVSAVRHGRIYDGFDNNLILRPGPRVLDGIAALRRCIQTPPAKPTPGEGP